MNTSLNRPLICLITKGDARPANFTQNKAEIVETVRRAATSGIPFVQIREKELSAKQIYEIALASVHAAAGSSVSILVNDRADIALAAGAAGVHLRSNSVKPSVVRHHFPKNFIVGVSTHTLAEVLEARDGGADFVVFGPVFDSPRKPNTSGLEELRRVCDLASPFRVLALGGIDGSNVQSVLDAGADGYAAIRYLNSNAGMKAASKHVYEPRS